MAEALFPPDPRGISHCDFDHMKLQVGDRLEFQLIPTTMHPRLFTHLIGYEPSLSLLVRTPYQNNLPVNVHEGQLVVVRAFSGTRAYAFTSQVQRICISPFLYLHLAFPREIQYREIRKDERLPVRLLAEARTGSQWHPVLLIDLGMGGALVESGHALGRQGDAVELRFSIPVEPMQAEVPLTVSGRILGVAPYEGDGGPVNWRHGVEFLEQAKGDRIVLQNFLFGMLIRGH